MIGGRPRADPLTTLSATGHGAADASGRRDRLAAVALLVWAFWLSAEYLVLGRHSYALLFDFGDSFIPYYLGPGRTGLWALFGGWEPRMLAGLDTAANTISQFRLTNLLAAAMPVWLAIGLLAFAQRALAGVFMYRLIVDAFDGHRGAAVAAAALFAIGMMPVGAEAYFGFTHNMGLAPCALPFLVWAHFRWQDARPRLLLAVLFAAGALMALSTMLFVALQALVCFALVLAVLTPVRRWPRLLPPLLALGLGYAVCELPNVIAVYADWAAAHRLQNPTIPVAERLTSAFNALRQVGSFQTAAVFAVVVAPFAAGWRALPHRALLLLAICVAVLFLDALFASLPGAPATLVNFSFIRIAFVIPFVLILAAGISLSRMLDSGAAAGRYAGAVLAGAVALSAAGQDAWIKFNNLRYYSHGSSYAVMYDQPPMRKVAALTPTVPPFRVATVNIQNVTHLNRPSFAWAYGLETVDGYVNVYPRRYQELWVAVIRRSARLTPFHYEKMRDWGNRLYLTAPGPDCADVRLGEAANLDLLSLFNVRFIVSPCPLRDGDLALFAANRDGPGQAWHGWSDRRKLMSILDGDFPSKELYVYENPRALPRYFLARAALVFETPAAALAALETADLATLRTTAILARPDVEGVADIPAGAADRPGTVNVVYIRRNEIRLSVAAPRPSVLVIANSYNPRWTVTVNGTPRRVFPADHAFQGVVVGAGRSDVVLRYHTALDGLLGRE